MKNSVLTILGTGMLLAAYTIPALALEPTVYPGYCFNKLSPDGTLAVTYAYGGGGFLNIATGETTEFGDDFHPGVGNAISLDGKVMGYNPPTETLTYWQNGEYYEIEDASTHIWSYANGITPDSKRIVGEVTPDNFEGYEGLMLVPCYWDLQDDGTYGKTNFLPCPTTDYTGRKPQYITAVCVSDDGKTICGQVLDYKGAIAQPIVYTQNANGEWNYTMLMAEDFKLDENLPPNPGESPLPEDFMSADNRKDYLAKLSQWWLVNGNAENQDWSTYPDYLDYMNANELAAYEDAETDWLIEFQRYDNALQRYENSVPNIGFNDVFVTADGSQYITCGTYREDNKVIYTPYIINVADGTYQTYPQDGIRPVLSSVAADGTMLGHYTNKYNIQEAYIMPAGETTFVPLQDYFAIHNPELAQWMKDNLYHEMYGMEFDPTIEDYIEVPVDGYNTGIPLTTPDMSLFSLAVDVNWDADDALTYGYLFSPGIAGVESLVAEPLDGVYKVYNLQGVKTLETKDATQIESLAKGIYIVNGKKVLVK